MDENKIYDVDGNEIEIPEELSNNKEEDNKNG